MDWDSQRPSRNNLRLQKFLAHCGWGSRRACEALIATGRVSVNGQVVSTQGRTIDPEKDQVLVDGKPSRLERKIYIVFNKPRDVLCTCDDPGKRRTFREFLPHVEGRIYPIGRLDRNSEGLLLLTNDGDFAQLLGHPRSHIPRVYEAWIEGVLSSSDQQRFLEGVENEGEILAAAEVEEIWPSRNQRHGYRLVLMTGKNRQIRRMFEAVGHVVKALKRLSYGPLTLKGLTMGHWRYLTREEITQLKESARTGSSSKEDGYEQDVRRTVHRSGDGRGRRSHGSRTTTTSPRQGRPR